MSESRIIFITLSVANKLRVVCDLVEQEYMNGNRVVINVADEEEGKSLDKMLWTWKQSSFIPHIFISDQSDSPEEPVLITDQIESIIAAHPCDAWIGLGNCDKIVPGMYNAMVRLNIPAVYVSGSPIFRRNMQDFPSVK